MQIKENPENGFSEMKSSEMKNPVARERLGFSFLLFSFNQ